MFEPWMINLGTLLVAGGTAYGGAKVALNGTRERVKDLKADFEQHSDDDHRLQTQITDRLARIETKLDMMMRNR